MINESMHPPLLMFSLPVRHSLMVVADEGTVLDRATSWQDWIGYEESPDGGGRSKTLLAQS